MEKKGQVWPCNRKQMPWAQTPEPSQGSPKPGWCLFSPTLGLLSSKLIMSQGTLEGGKNPQSLSMPCLLGTVPGRMCWDAFLDEVPAWECPVCWVPGSVPS